MDHPRVESMHDRPGWINAMLLEIVTPPGVREAPAEQPGLVAVSADHRGPTLRTPGTPGGLVVAGMPELFRRARIERGPELHRQMQQLHVVLSHA